jgi:hypothetical protein
MRIMLCVTVAVLFCFLRWTSLAIDAALVTTASTCNYEITLISNTVTEISDKLSVTPNKFDAT